MNNFSWLIKKSFILDYKFLKASRWPIIKKNNFILKKYYLIFKHFFKPFSLGKSNINFYKDKIFYDTQFGLADYQSILSRHQKMLKIAKINNADTVIDIGANVGFFSKLIRDLFPKCNIYSIEPIPAIFQCLKSNFSYDTKTKLYNLAISNIIGTAKMIFDQTNSAESHLSKFGKIKVKTETLDNFINKNKISSIDILKIDTEGFEKHVLEQASQALLITKYLFLEITIENNNNYTISSLLKLLSTENYNFQLIGFRNYADTNEGSIPIMDALFINKKLSSHNNANI